MSLQIPFEQMSHSQKLFTYIQTRQTILEERAIHSDGTSNYRSPAEPEKNELVTLKLRTAKDNVDEVYLCYGEQRVLLNVISKDELFDYYEGNIQLSSKKVRYYFELKTGKLNVYYNKKGVTREPDHYYNFKIAPGFKTPDWAKGAVMYQIFVDRFNNGDTTNDVEDDEYLYIGKPAKKVTNWNKLPDADGIREFYGGDLQGVIDKLDYLKELGIDAIYFNPIFVSPSNHKYDTQDYDFVDPHYGKIINDTGEILSGEKMDNNLASKYITRTTETMNLEASNDLFANLVNEAHGRNIKVILDGVFNHCGSFNKWMDREKFYANSHNYPKGAYTSNGSPYFSFFHFYNKEAWPDNSNYDGWWGHETLPKLNYEGSPKLYHYVMEIAKKWVSKPYNVDGWRLDVAADLGYTKEFNHQFWRDFRQGIKSVNPEAMILAEHYGDPTDWLEGDQWDTVMNYDAFMEPVGWFLTGMEKHSEEFRHDLVGNYQAFFDAMRHNMARYHSQSLQVAMNELSNHDHARFLTRTNRQVGRTHTVGAAKANEGVNMGVMKEAVVIQMTWIGAPTIYYGDEAGVCGWTDPDNRRTYPWGNEDKELIAVHKSLISIRKAIPALKQGSIKFLYGEYNIISYGRWDDKDKIIVAVNNNDHKKTIWIPVWEIGITNAEICQQMLETTRNGHSTEAIKYDVVRGKVMVEMEAYSAKIIKCKDQYNE